MACSTMRCTGLPLGRFFNRVHSGKPVNAVVELNRFVSRDDFLA